MQNRPAPSRSPGLWSRLPVIGRLLVAFWGLVLVGGTTAALMLRHQSQPSTPPVTAQNKPLAPIAHQPDAVAANHSMRQPMPAAQQTAAASKPVPVTVPAPPAPAVKSPQMPPPIAQTPAIDLSSITASGKTALAIVLQGFGYSDAMTYDVLSRIPAPVAVGVSPYIGNLPDILARAHAAHREIFVTLPMQSAHPETVDEGPHALGNGNSEADDRRELDWCLSRAQGATGLTDTSEAGDSEPGGGYATTPGFHPIEDIIASHGLLYLSGSSQEDRHIRGMTATAWINGDTDAATLDAKLATLLPEGAKPTHILLMVGPLTPVAIDRLATWLSGPAANRFVLVPPSALADNGATEEQAAAQSKDIQTAPL
ncbi:Divergent polysaccharide deacetylase [Gluconobacter japonicus]|nr:Divergent polysaccharide deacetylase [Gluconobacter japonicus]